MTYKLTKLTESDLRDIWLYTSSNWGEEKADKYLFAL